MTPHSLGRGTTCAGGGAAVAKRNTFPFPVSPHMLRWNEVRGVYLDTRSATWTPQPDAAYHYIPIIGSRGRRSGDE